jgi:Egh16-like virulence factor
MLVKMGLVKRARNVNEDYPFSATIPAGTTCSGTVAGQSNVCLVKLVNPSGAGPFGGVIAIQMAGAGAAAGAGNSSTADTGSTAGSAGNGAAAAAVPSSVGAGSQTAAAEEAKKGGAAGKALRPKPVGAKFRA